MIQMQVTSAHDVTPIRLQTGRSLTTNRTCTIYGTTCVEQLPRLLSLVSGRPFNQLVPSPHCAAVKSTKHRGS